MARVRVAWFPPNEAEVARGVLVSAGLDAVVVGEARSALLGALPPTDFQVELWVEETQLEKARELLEGTVEVEQRDDTPTPSRPPSRGSWLTVALVLACLGLAYGWWSERSQRGLNPNYDFEVVDGCATSLLRGRRHMVHCDANLDGNAERVELYDRDGVLRMISFDSNEDGFAERSDFFDARGKLTLRGLDVDDAWWQSRSDVFDDDGALLGHYFDDDRDGRSDRLVLRRADGGMMTLVTAYRNGAIEEVELTPTSTLRYSRRGELASFVVERDGGVVRRQMLSPNGWDDVTP